MKFKIKNNSTTTTVWIDNCTQGNAFSLSPGETCSVPEHTVPYLLKEYSFLENLGTTTDFNVPAYYSGVPTSTWQLIRVGPGGDSQYTLWKFWASATGVQVSFSGWDTSKGETAPPSWSIIDAPVVSGSVNGNVGEIQFNDSMDPTNYFYAKSTGGTLTVFAS